MTLRLWIAAVVGLAAGAGLAAPPQAPAGLEDLLRQVAAYDYGQNRRPVAELDAFLRDAHSSRAALGPIEQRLLKFLAGDATPAAKEIVCRHLGVIGSAASVPALEKMLAVPATAEVARYALERISAPEAGAALRNALRKALREASGRQQIGLINSLGARRDHEAVQLIAPLLSSPGSELVSAAAGALGDIGGTESEKALEAALPALRGYSVREALLRCAERRMAGRQPEAALRIYRRLSGEDEPEPIRVAALRGQSAAGPTEALPVLSGALNDKAPAVRRAAIQLLGGMPGEAAPSTLVKRMAAFPPDEQVLAIGALALRRDAISRQAAARAAASEHAVVRLAALRALGVCGDASSLILLAEAASGADPEQQKAARESLAALRGEAVDRAIVAGLSSAAGKIRLELIRAAGERATPGAADALLTAASDPDASVRREAVRALREVAGEKEMPRVIGLLLASASAADRREAERTLMGMVRRTKASPTALLEEAWRKATAPETRASILQVMGVAGRADSLPVFREALAGSESEIKRAAILALSSWPDATPLEDLLRVANGDANPAHQVLALRGYIKLVALPSERDPARTAALLGQAWQAARQAEEKKAILAALQAAPCAESLALAQRAAGDADVAKEAGLAVNVLKRALARMKN